MTPTSTRLQRRRSNAWILGLFAVLASGVLFYGAIAALLPLRGEETRRGRFASEMLASGDWIVSTQQDAPFIDRPPLQYWTIAATYLVLDPPSVASLRLHAVAATIATGLLCWWTARRTLGERCAITAGLMYLSAGQVLDIGARGETEALFVALLTASLLAWLEGYRRGWGPWLTWGIAAILAGLATLAKGSQGPITFFGVTWGFLVLRRDWKWLVSPAHALGIILFAAVVAIWAVPLALRMGWVRPWEALFGQAAMRLDSSPADLLKQLFVHPLRLLAGMLPWSPLLLGFLWPPLRRSLGESGTDATFLGLAVLVVFLPTWIVAASAGRYALPAYPFAAILAAMSIAPPTVIAAKDSRHAGWLAYAGAWAFVLLALAIGLAGLAFYSAAASDRPGWVPHPAAALPVAAVAGAAGLFSLRHRRAPEHAWAVSSTIACAVAIFTIAIVVGGRHRTAYPLRARVEDLKASLPPGTRLESIGPVNHRFAFWFDDPIELLLPKGRTTDRLAWYFDEREALARQREPSDYFCFDRWAGRRDPAGFAFEELAAIGMNTYEGPPDGFVVIARRIHQ